MRVIDESELHAHPSTFLAIARCPLCIVKRSVHIILEYIMHRLSGCAFIFTSYARHQASLLTHRRKKGADDNLFKKNPGLTTTYLNPHPPFTPALCPALRFESWCLLECVRSIAAAAVSRTAGRSAEISSLLSKSTSKWEKECLHYAQSRASSCADHDANRTYVMLLCQASSVPTLLCTHRYIGPYQRTTVAIIQIIRS